MNRIVSINSGNHGSTGRIMRGISHIAREKGYETYMAYPKCKYTQPAEDNDIIICSSFWNRVNQKIAYYTGMNGCFAVISTKRFLRKLEKIKPDILHFHNLHNSYINLPMLFDYVKKHKIKVVWTLHDCWSFTGHCPYFTMAGCDKWKTGCGKCPQLSVYPFTKIDLTTKMWKWKKKWFLGIGDLTIVTPSEWLAGLVRQSFLSEYPVKVINNGIDLSAFKPTESDFRETHGISEGGVMLLGVAFDWSKYKGLDVFISLANKLPEQYKIVLVGTTDAVDAILPSNIISIHRTDSKEEMAAIYSAADFFVNPTREDNFPSVNIESLACGTPVVTFDTNGSPEIIDETCGEIVPYNDIDGLIKKILEISESNKFAKIDCITRAYRYEQMLKFKEYVSCYG